METILSNGSDQQQAVTLTDHPLPAFLGSDCGLKVLSADTYHQNPAVGSSGLKKIMRSPAHYQEFRLNPPEPTPTMQFGTAFHTALLEPDVFSRDYAVAPKFDRRTKKGKEAAEAWDSVNASKTALTREQTDSIQKMVASVRAHTGASLVLSNGIAEMSGFWKDEETGVACKCRPDFIGYDPSGLYLVDVKTCCDASIEGFARVIANLSYDVQAAFYIDGIRRVTGLTPKQFIFIAVEKDAPHMTAVYTASNEMIAIGREKYRGALQLLKWCTQHKHWPGYQPHGLVESIDLPRWAANFTLDD
ncbi:MAG: PD-(D/E)XK nuclease-like domain-containing protein [Nitrosomonas sp.]|uniref:Putative exodeoxyribonuclease 8 PDDEXK-like domain-containing protein n=1 Tax=Nitrosomonas aestuarii TaxID=52441 RepID=A0A1I4FSX6_9PROT|nr:PD-(D/E)XK nuclease-like domain-containing protein [Nitrosomonas aestuarii]MBX3630656.1 PD-(D/E)XK nuclease-like domain-containing protein [Nitrosomonas sp.]SFL21022.1 PDDEXK-like protein of unknown function [Nitrosomonas aestuarii]